MPRVVAGLFTVFLLAACQTPGQMGGTEVSPTAGGGTNAVATSNVDTTTHPNITMIVGSENLLGEVAIVQPRMRTVGALRQAAVSIQNFSDERLTVEYRDDWVDADGFSVDSLSAWQRMTLGPQEARPVSFMGKTPTADSVTVIVRQPGDVFMRLNNEETE